MRSSGCFHLARCSCRRWRQRGRCVCCRLAASASRFVSQAWAGPYTVVRWSWCLEDTSIGLGQCGGFWGCRLLRPLLPVVRLLLLCCLRSGVRLLLVHGGNAGVRLRPCGGSHLRSSGASFGQPCSGVCRRQHRGIRLRRAVCGLLSAAAMTVLVARR
jgi:hypothetical protein